MRTNKDMLNGYIALSGINKKELSNRLDINVSTLYKKVGGEFSDFNRKELLKIKAILSLSNDVFIDIFFS